jgi:hypothetical protein
LCIELNQGRPASENKQLMLLWNLQEEISLDCVGLEKVKHLQLKMLTSAQMLAVARKATVFADTSAVCR